MTSLEQQLSLFSSRLEQYRDAMLVDPEAAGLTIEMHSYGNGNTYTRGSE